MENAIARNSEPPKLKPVEMESLILNQLASVLPPRQPAGSQWC